MTCPSPTFKRLFYTVGVPEKYIWRPRHMVADSSFRHLQIVNSALFRTHAHTHQVKYTCVISIPDTHCLLLTRTIYRLSLLAVAGRSFGNDGVRGPNLLLGGAFPVCKVSVRLQRGTKMPLREG